MTSFIDKKFYIQSEKSVLSTLKKKKKLFKKVLKNFKIYNIYKE